MRYLINKSSSTKYERMVYEILKEFHIPFKHRWIINGLEIDFLIFNNVCLELNGHTQDVNKNEKLVESGYVPIHLDNSEVSRETIINLINNYK